MRAWLPLTLLLTVSLIAGCITNETDGGGSTPDTAAHRMWTLPETIEDAEHLQQMAFVMDDGTEVKMSVAGIWLHDDLLYTSGTALSIVDVADPERPVVLSVMGDETASRDVDIMEHPNGRLYAVLAARPGVVLVDVTDPEAPVYVSNVTIGYHNIAVVPGTALVYNSRSVYRGETPVTPPAPVPDPNAGPDGITEGGRVDIIDFTVPEEPQVSEFRFPRVVDTVGGRPKVSHSVACHDISVYPEVDRAYCAGVTETSVWDIADPKAPKIIQIIDNPGTNIHHAAYANQDHTVLIIGDELGGAIASPGCTVSDQPYGGVWFVDISDLGSPRPLGWWAPETPHADPVYVDPGAEIPAGFTTCTAHFGNLIEDRSLLVMGYYTAGVFIVDFSDPTDPKEIANFRPGGSVWEGQYYRGHIYTGDMARGVDLLKPTGIGEVVYSDAPPGAHDDGHQH